MSSPLGFFVTSLLYPYVVLPISYVIDTSHGNSITKERSWGVVRRTCVLGTVIDLGLVLVLVVCVLVLL